MLHKKKTDKKQQAAAHNTNNVEGEGAGNADTYT
jgi:hypothetical protein